MTPADERPSDGGGTPRTRCTADTAGRSDTDIGR